MTEQTNAELVKLAAILSDPNFSLSVPEEAKRVIRTLAERLEAAEQERDNWKLSAEEAERAEQRAEKRAEEAEATAEHLHDEDSREIVALTQERDAALAVIKKVREWADEAIGYAEPAGDSVANLLATAPADALREHDAKVRAEALREAHADLQAYTDSGAPFGHRPVEEFLLHRADRIEREAGLK